MNKLIVGAMGIIACVPLLPLSAHADYGRHRDWHDGHRWHGDIRVFHERDMGHWQTGYWHRGRHAGRFGWWWVVGGAWYLYSAPVYPYPDPYLPPIVVQQSAPVYVEQPRQVVPQVVAPPAAPVAQPLPPPVAVSQYWYYCKKPQGYYPYVPECKVPWDKVPATPPQ